MKEECNIQHPVECADWVWCCSVYRWEQWQQLWRCVLGVGILSVIWCLFSNCKSHPRWVIDPQHNCCGWFGTNCGFSLSLSQFFIFMALAIKLKQQQSDFSLTDDEVTAFYGSTRGCCLLWPLWVAVHTALLIEKTVTVMQFRVIQCLS